MLGGEGDCDGGAQGFAEGDNALRIDVAACGQIAEGGACVGGQAGFGRAAGVATVAAIIEEHHGQAGVCQSDGQGRSHFPIAGVAVEHEHSSFCLGLSGCRQEPSRQRQPVLGHERHRFAARQHGLDRWRFRGQGEINQTALE